MADPREPKRAPLWNGVLLALIAVIAVDYTVTVLTSAGAGLVAALGCAVILSLVMRRQIAVPA